MKNPFVVHAARAVFALLVSSFLFAIPASAQFAECNEPLPFDPATVTKVVGFRSYDGSMQMGPACYVNWTDGKGKPVTVMVYGPRGLASVAPEVRTAKDLAKRYAVESPKGVEAIPGVKNGFMVFDPKTPNRRVCIEHAGKPYLVNVSGEAIPVEKLAAVLEP